MKQPDSSGASHGLEIIEAKPLRVLPPARKSKDKKLDLKDAKEYGLPEGWQVEQRARTNVRYIGKTDQYFYEPGTRKQFRSLKSVFNHLELKTERNPQIPAEASLLDYSKASQSSNPESSNSQQQKKRKKRSPTVNLANPPEKITWALTNAESDEWNPYIGQTKVPEQEKLDWAETFIFINGVNIAPERR